MGGDDIVVGDVNDLSDPDLSPIGTGVVGRGRRTTSTGNVTTTETGVLRLEVPVYAGRLYMIKTSNINIDTSVDNDIGRVAVRYSTSGNATTSSTLGNYVRETIDSATNSNVHDLTMFYVASADATLSVLLTLLRQGGTGNLIVFCSGTDILDLVVTDLGPDPGDSGTVI